ncbi:PI31 proteasome regulator N-terminal-domain-containing protein [Thamnidium elegans]|nr:PI31 proteasome regulator N-terminal-domain-containing protein [Thamnidium elegans]
MSKPTDSNVLDPSVILHATSQAASQLNNTYDAVAAACHAIMLSVGFRFAGLGDDARQEGDGTIKVLPESWNNNGPHCYQFRYSHPQSSLTFVIKIVRLGDKCIILGLGIGDNKTATLDITTSDYTSESFFPYTDNSKPLAHGFISTSRFNDFVKAYKLNILQRLIPGLNKPGYEDNSSTTTTTSSSDNVPNPNVERRQPRYNDPPLTYDPVFPDVGASDLNPLGGGLRLPGGGNGGMFVGPDHPLFGNRGSSSQDDPSGLFGGPQSLPRGSVPPGARFDPIGPFGRLPVRPPGPGGRGGPRGPHSGDPDNDELQPPGYNDMFG